MAWPRRVGELPALVQPLPGWNTPVCFRSPQVPCVTAHRVSALQRSSPPASVSAACLPLPPPFDPQHQSQGRQRRAGGEGKRVFISRQRCPLPLIWGFTPGFPSGQLSFATFPSPRGCGSITATLGAAPQSPSLVQDYRGDIAGRCNKPAGWKAVPAFSAAPSGPRRLSCQLTDWVQDV